MTTRSRLHVLVDAFAGRRVLVYGDLVLDRFILGSPKRISREAPVIILRWQGQRDIPGGGANAMANIAALGGITVPVGVVGDDEPGASLLAALSERGVETSGITVVPGFRTVTKVRVLAGGPAALKHQVARFDIEDSLHEDDQRRAAVTERLTACAAQAEAVAVSDYGYGVVTSSGIASLRRAVPPGVLTVADSRFNLLHVGAVDGATPNLEELCAATGVPLATDDAIAAASEALRRRLDARFLLTTRGSQGATLVEQDKVATHLPVHGSDEVADVTGAGDTVLATLTLALAAGATPVEGALLANLAGGIVVTKLGTATASREELHRAIEEASFVDA